MKDRRKQRGVALIICLFALMLLSGIGLAMMYMADTDTSINKNYRDAQLAYFAASAGLQQARARLITGSTFVPPTTLPGNNVSTGVVYIINYTNSIPQSSIKPWDTTAGNPYFDTEFCHENFVGSGGSALVTNSGANVPCPVNSSSVPTGTWYTSVASSLPSSNPPLLGTDANIPYRWVRVTLKSNASAVPDTSTALPNSFYVAGNPSGGAYGSNGTIPICWNGFNELPKPAGYGTCDDNPPPDAITYLKSVYVLTSLAVTNGGSRRMAQMEVANDPPFVTNAAVDTNNFVTVSGSSVTVNGYDNCKCSCTVGKGSSTPTCTDRTTGTACTGSTYSIFSSQSVTTSGGPALVAGTSPPYAQNQTFPYDVNALISKYSSMAGAVNITGAPYNQTCVAGTPPAYNNCGLISNGTFGTAPNPFPPTDPTNPVGSVDQITYVPGSIDITANTSGSGILIVDGDLTLHAGLNFYGLIIVRGVLTYSGSGNGQELNVAGSIIAGQGSVADALSGGINIQYDHCALLHDINPQPPAMIATHESSY